MENFEQRPKIEKTSLKKDIIDMTIYFIIVVLAAYLTVNFVAQRTMVDGDSMYPTLHNRDNLIVDKISYRFGEIDRFDIVVFEYPHKEDVHYIKRIIGLPGETVQIIDGMIYINGELLEESYGYEVMRNAYRAERPIHLGEDEYFVLGDNRNDSTDSRSDSVANVHRSQIVGRAFVRIYPFNRIGVLRHQ